jgi:integrase/recombinase XerD
MTKPRHSVGAQNRSMNPGFLSSNLEAFLLDLETRGYTRLTMGGYADSIAHFAEWARARGLAAIKDLSDEVLTRFAKHRCRCPGARRHHSVSRKYVKRVRRFFCYLDAQGAIAPVQSAPAARVNGLLVDEFVRWLCDHRGIGPITVSHYTEQLEKLPYWIINAEVGRIKAASVRALVLERAPRQSASATRIMSTAVRMYLRFLGSTGRCAAGLEGVIPSAPQWKLSALPRYLPPDQVEQLVASCDITTLLGARDRAVLLLLARLGLRAGDIVDLCLDDIDWRAGRLKVCGKGHRETWLPLPQDAGDAVLKYLKKRPAVALDRVFLCAQAPYRSLQSSGVVSSIVDHALRKAGIKDPPSRGATLLRHSAATAMLRGGATLDAVSAMLRHRSLDMTVHYAKVDLPMLQRVAQPWPEGVSC